MGKDSRAFDLPDPNMLGSTSESGGEQVNNPTATVLPALLDKHHDSLMALPGVTMIGESQDAAGRPAVIIGVKTAKHLAGLPNSVDGVPIIAQVTGPISAQ